MLTADIQLNEFNRGLARYKTQLGLDAQRVMRTELGQLVKTLVRISPPKDRAKSIRMMKHKIEKKFTGLRTQQNNYDQVDIKPSRSGLKYWASNSNYLFAGAADADMTKATTKELRAVHYRVRRQSGSYRIVVPFRIPRKKQRVAITTKIFTTEKQIKKLGARIAQNFGRLKAGWLAPLKKGAISAGGKFPVPQWVKRHMPGLRGDFIDNIGLGSSPSFTIINRAKGVSEKNSMFFINLALKIRAKAMAANAKMILEGKKKYVYS